MGTPHKHVTLCLISTSRARLLLRQFALCVYTWLFVLLSMRDIVTSIYCKMKRKDLQLYCSNIGSLFLGWNLYIFNVHYSFIILVPCWERERMEGDSKRACKYCHANQHHCVRKGYAYLTYFLLTFFSVYIAFFWWTTWIRGGQNPLYSD